MCLSLCLLLFWSRSIKCFTSIKLLVCTSLLIMHGLNFTSLKPKLNLFNYIFYLKKLLFFLSVCESLNCGIKKETSPLTHFMMWEFFLCLFFMWFSNDLSQSTVCLCEHCCGESQLTLNQVSISCCCWVSWLSLHGNTFHLILQCW